MKKDRQTERKEGGQTERQRDRKADRWKERRQTEREQVLARQCSWCTSKVLLK